MHSVLIFERALSPFLSNPIRASSVARTPSATIFSTTCLVLGGSSPSLIPATGFAFASGLANPPCLYTLHYTPYPNPHSNHKMMRIIHFFASKLAYITKKHYLCSEFVAISVLVCDKIKYKYTWNQLRIRLLAR